MTIAGTVSYSSSLTLENPLHLPLVYIFVESEGRLTNKFRIWNIVGTSIAPILI